MSKCSRCRIRATNSICWPAPATALAACSPDIRIPFLLMTAAGPAILHPHRARKQALRPRHRRHERLFCLYSDALRDVDVSQLENRSTSSATADEETSMAGACYFAETTLLRPDCAIIGEPYLSAAGTRAQRPYVQRHPYPGAVRPSSDRRAASTPLS